MARVCRNFYLSGAVEAAQALLGCYLVRRVDGQTLVGRITETEAYVGAVDKACHAYGYRRTQRNDVMFGAGGYCYVYFIYGMHHCLNFVVNVPGEPDAVLLRGLEPLHGFDGMSLRRYGKPWDALTSVQRKNLLNGPGKCCQALGIDRTMNGADLTGEEIFVCTSLADAGLAAETPPPFTIEAGPRIGIDYAEEAAAFLWRFQWKRST